MQKDNKEEIIIIAIFYTKSGIIEEKTFRKEVTFGEILNYIKMNYKNTLFNVKQNYNYNGIILKPDDIIKNLAYLQKGKSYEIEIRIELNERVLLDDESDPILNKIIKPKLYNFGLYIYFPKKGILNLEEYKIDDIKEYNLNQISSSSSYCNSPDSFFISGGGVISQNPINYFWIINKEDLSVKMKNMPFGKKEHSMIYIPNEIVFIIGGNDKKCCFYNIQKDNFSKWADLNAQHTKPALIHYKNYIYCFNELTKEKNYFERTNTSNKYSLWEKIFPKFKRNTYLYNKKIFWVSKCANNSIIFGAGDSIKTSKIYLYDLINNEISIFEKQSEINELDNKTFVKVSKYYNIAIPKHFNREKNILVLDKKEKKLSKIFFEDFNDYNKIKMKDYDDEENEVSSIKIKTISLDNSPIKIKKNNSFTKKLKNINNDSIFKNLGNEYIEEENENENEQQKNYNTSRAINANNNQIINNKFYNLYEPEQISNNYNKNNIPKQPSNINNNFQIEEKEKFPNNRKDNENIINSNTNKVEKENFSNSNNSNLNSQKTLKNNYNENKGGTNKMEIKNVQKRKIKLPSVEKNVQINKSKISNNINNINEVNIYRNNENPLIRSDQN